MERYIKTFNEFLTEHIDFVKNINSINEAEELELQEFVSIVEAVNSLQGLPDKWMQVITNKYNKQGLGGENSIRASVPIKASQKKKVFGYLKDGYFDPALNQTLPVLAMMAFTEGQPAFMIFKDQWSYSEKSASWKLMIGDALYYEKIDKHRFNRRRGGYDSWTEKEDTFGEKKIMDVLPEGDFDMQLITVDVNRMEMRSKRAEIAKLTGIKNPEGIQKETIYKNILGKIKPQVDEIVQKISDDIKNNLISAIDEIFNPDVDYPRGIDIDIEASVRKLQEISYKLKQARYTIDAIFPYSRRFVSPEAIVKNTKNSNLDSDKKNWEEFKELLNKGIVIN